jgi:HAD superfamily hydrolase (TIGR01450 family)
MVMDIPPSCTTDESVPGEREPREISMAELLLMHSEVLFDAYGVLVDGAGALPHAAATIAELKRRNTPFAVVTNDASRSARRCATRFASLGIEVDASQIVTSGQLIADYFALHQLHGARALVLGTDDSHDYLRAAGATCCELKSGMEVDAIVICDDAGFSFLAGAELALSAAIRQLDAGHSIHLVLPNPDVVYPKSAGEFGFTAGAIALMIEHALARRYPQLAPRFARLGKPSPSLLQRGAHITGGRPIMIGDQMDTDIAAAHAASLPSALVAGVSRWPIAVAHHRLMPTYVLSSLRL